MVFVFECKNSNYASIIRCVKSFDSSDSSSHIIIPGVSSFDVAVRNFHDEVNTCDCFSTASYIIGICAGAQILFESSEEGIEPGLGLLSGRVKKIATNANIKVPHLGWNKIILNQNHPMAYLFDGVDLENKKFYFSHSYRFPDSEHALAYVDYGERFPVVVAKDNIIAIQFHPEKSYEQGLQLLKNICSL